VRRGRRCVWAKVAGLIAAAAAAAALAPGAAAAPGIEIGFYDEALTLEYPDEFGFETLQDLNADVLRMNLYWHKVATRRPKNAGNPKDPAYDWRQYDRAMARAKKHGIDIILSIIGTPKWANGGQSWEYAPTSPADLASFATAAAKRYPQVARWLAWNEPNAPNFLKPQSVETATGWQFTSPGIYARICNAIVDGVNRAQKRDTVACGVLNPRGKSEPNGRRDSVAPVLFLEGMKAAGARPEVLAYHPYTWTPKITPTTPVRSTNAITIGNFGLLVSAINRLYGKGMRIWVTEYGYQTAPPDPDFGVTWAEQATYMRQAFAFFREHPRIDVALWFLLKDDSRIAGWQSGVISTDNERKPSYDTFKNL
jgi:hypothetical protein